MMQSSSSFVGLTGKIKFCTKLSILMNRKLLISSPLQQCFKLIQSSNYTQDHQQASSSSSGGIVNLSYHLNDKFNSNKALVIAHGLFASKLSWRSIARRLNEQTKQKIYTVDLRNHGDSVPYVDKMNYIEMANDLGHFIESVVVQQDKVDHITLLGHSMGGKTAMSLVLKNPNIKIDKLIVADVSPNRSPSVNNIKLYIDKMSSIDTTQLIPSIFKARKEVDAKLCEVPELKQDPNQRQFLLTRLVERDGKIIWHFNLNSIKNHFEDIMEFPTFNTQFHKSSLFVGGELSNYIKEKDESDIAKYFTNYKIVKVPRAGHVIHFDNPVDTIKIIDQFINQ